MNGLVLIGVCLLIGFALARAKGIPDALPGALATFAVRVSLPALVLQHLHALPLDSGVLLPTAMPLLVFLLVAGLAWMAGRLYGLKRETVGCLTLVCGTGNTSIVGAPMVQAFVGEEAVGYALVADQSNFIVMSTLGLLAANFYSSRNGGSVSILHRIVTYPPVLAMVAALVLRPMVFPAWLVHVLSVLGATLTPLAIVSVGAGMRLDHLGSRFGAFAAGAGFKLALAPAAIFLLYRLLPGAGGLVFTTSVLQAAMPPMIVAGLIAVERKLDPPLSMMLVGLGIPLSFLTIFLWSLVCR